MPGRTEWAIAIYEGDSPLSLAPAAGLVNPVITRHHVKDIEAAFVADPFMVRAGESWFLFCEVKKRAHSPWGNWSCNQR